MVACSGEPTEETSNTNVDQEPTEEITETPEEEEVVEVNHDSLMNVAKSLRTAIEENLETYTTQTLQTSEMREQIKQKWSKIDYYLNGETVVRIKTYPHEGISTRTEEFYYNEEGNLVAVVIEDKGAGKKGAQQEATDKAYYFNNEEFVGEANESGEMEFSIKNSDAERLLQESKEYKEYLNK